MIKILFLALSLATNAKGTQNEIMNWSEVEAKLTGPFSATLVDTTLQNYLKENSSCLSKLTPEPLRLSGPTTLYFEDSYFEVEEEKFDFARLRKRYHRYPVSWLDWLPGFKPHRIEFQKKGSYIWNSTGYYRALEERQVLEKAPADKRNELFQVV